MPPTYLEKLTERFFSWGWPELTFSCYAWISLHHWHKLQWLNPPKCFWYKIMWGALQNVNLLQCLSCHTSLPKWSFRWSNVSSVRIVLTTHIWCAYVHIVNLDYMQKCALWALLLRALCQSCKYHAVTSLSTAYIHPPLALSFLLHYSTYIPAAEGKFPALLKGKSLRL